MQQKRERKVKERSGHRDSFVSQTPKLRSSTDSSSKLSLKWLGWCYTDCHLRSD